MSDYEDIRRMLQTPSWQAFLETVVDPLVDSTKVALCNGGPEVNPQQVAYSRGFLDALLRIRNLQEIPK